MNDKIRLMFYADSYAGTSGYSKVGRELAKRLAKDDRFDIYFQEITTSTPLTIQDNVKILPCLSQRGSQLFTNVMLHHLRIFSPHIFLPICDTFLLERDNIHNINFTNIKFMPYIMVDSENLPDYSELILNKAKKIITGSKFGQSEMKKQGFDANILFHGVDFEKYKPITDELKKLLRVDNGLPENKKIFLFVGRNFLRKRPQRLMEAIALYNKNNPDNNAHFYLHITDHDMKQWSLPLFKDRLEKDYNVKLDNIQFSSPHTLGKGVEEKDLIELYQACDYYITASSGEGFGFPIVEAMACGKPVIAPDNTTHSTFLADGRGILVPNEGFSYTGFGTKQLLVNIEELTKAIETAMTMSKENYQEIIDKSLVWVKENCDWDKIAEQLKIIITSED